MRQPSVESWHDGTGIRLYLALRTLKERIKAWVWRWFGGIIRSRLTVHQWRQLLHLLKYGGRGRRGYPDYLSTVVDEARQEFIEGKYLSCVLVSSASVEWVLISELERVGKKERSLVKRIKAADELGLPINELFDKNEDTSKPWNSMFVRRRNAVAHGNMHEVPYREGPIKSKWPVEFFMPTRTPISASDALDQYRKAMNFLIKWRIQTTSRLSQLPSSKVKPYPSITT